MLKNTMLFNPDLKFLNLLEELNKSGNGFLVIIDANGKLIGIVTDGDIRRAILNKTTDSLKDVINFSPITASSKLSNREKLNLLKDIKRRQIPVLDQNNCLVEIFYLDDEDVHYHENHVIIMAGGLGSRLGDLTKEIPKPMLEVGGKPILERIIYSFKESGYNKFIICLNYKGEIIKNYFNDGSDFGVEIQYTFEEKRMGTAGALGLIKNQLNDPFFVVNADILTTAKYDELMTYHIRSNAVATMCVKKMQYQIPYATIEIDALNQIQSITEKPIHEYKINTGIYVLNPELLLSIAKNEYLDMTTLFDSMKNKEFKLLTYDFDEYWLDIGIKSDFIKANLDISI
jgi:dTDP-glucose pyrophosphorylase